MGTGGSLDQRQIGELDVSVVGLGCNNFGRRIDAAQAERVVHAALDAGITLFDTADVYGPRLSEEYLGRALRGHRQEAIVATKFGKPVGGTRASATAGYIRSSIDASLRRLGTDYVDLYQIHEPHPDVPIEETLGALDELIRAGKVREIGCSNFSAHELEEAEASARLKQGARFVSVQNEYSLLERAPEQDGVLEACERLGIALIPFFPLASGLLTGKYRRNREAPPGSRLASGWGSDRLNDENLEVVERLIAFAASRSRTILELAFSWLLARPQVASVIAGATSSEQVRANARAATWRLTSEDLQNVDNALGACL